MSIILICVLNLNVVNFCPKTNTNIFLSKLVNCFKSKIIKIENKLK